MLVKSCLYLANAMLNIPPILCSLIAQASLFPLFYCDCNHDELRLRWPLLSGLEEVSIYGNGYFEFAIHNAVHVCTSALDVIFVQFFKFIIVLSSNGTGLYLKTFKQYFSTTQQSTTQQSPPDRKIAVLHRALSCRIKGFRISWYGGKSWWVHTLALGGSLSNGCRKWLVLFSEVVRLIKTVVKIAIKQPLEAEIFWNYCCKKCQIVLKLGVNIESSMGKNFTTLK